MQTGISSATVYLGHRIIDSAHTVYITVLCSDFQIFAEPCIQIFLWKLS